MRWVWIEHATFRSSVWRSPNWAIPAFVHAGRPNLELFSMYLPAMHPHSCGSRQGAIQSYSVYYLLLWIWKMAGTWTWTTFFSESGRSPPHESSATLNIHSVYGLMLIRTRLCFCKACMSTKLYKCFWKPNIWVLSLLHYLPPHQEVKNPWSHFKSAFSSETHKHLAGFLD